MRFGVVGGGDELVGADGVVQCEGRREAVFWGCWLQVGDGGRGGGRGWSGRE